MRKTSKKNLKFYSAYGASSLVSANLMHNWDNTRQYSQI